MRGGEPRSRGETVRALSSPNRVLAAAAILVAAALVLGGAYFVGYIGEVQRALHDPPPLKAKVAEQITALEAELGYDGFLKAYRAYRLTGESAARRDLLKHATEGARILENLSVSYRANAAAEAALHEARAVVRTFAHVAATAPETGPLALRGSTAMDTIAALPQAHQLETAHLSLRGALDRLIAADRNAEFGGAASALSWSQGLLIVAVASLVFALVATAATLLQFGFTTPEKWLGAQSANRREQEASKLAATPLQHEIQALRNEIKELSIRIAEDQILATAGGPLFGTGGGGLEAQRATRTLADVPQAEVQSRLKDLAAEMSAAQEQIAADLRGVADRAQSPDQLGSQALRDDAAELGARSEALATRLETSRRSLPLDVGAGSANTIDAAALDVATLADTIAQLEARAENLSKAAVATRFDVIPDTLNPSELVDGARAAEQKTDAVVRTVFEAIDRLNNIAAALARAGEVERQRKTAHQK